MGLQVPHQRLGPRHAQGIGETLAHQRFTDFEKLGCRDWQVQCLYHIVSQVLSAPADDVLLDAPVVGSAVAFGDDLRDFGVDALGIQQQPVHIENHGLDRADCGTRCIHHNRTLGEGLKGFSTITAHVACKQPSPPQTCAHRHA